MKFHVRTVLAVAIQAAVIVGGFATLVQAALPTPNGTGFAQVIDGGPQANATYNTTATTVTELGDKTNAPATSQTNPVSFTSSTAWVNGLTLAPDAGTQWDCYPVLEVHGFEGLSDGGVSGLDAQASGAYPTGNQTKANGEFHIITLALQQDGAAGEQVQVNVPGYTSGAGPFPLKMTDIVDQHGCTTSNGNGTGCVNDGTTGFTSQVFVDSGVVVLQYQDTSNAVGFPVSGQVLSDCRARSF